MQEFYMSETKDILSEVNNIISKNENETSLMATIIESKPEIDDLVKSGRAATILAKRSGTQSRKYRWSNTSFEPEIAHEILHFYANDPLITLRELFEQKGQSWPPLYMFLDWCNKNYGGIGDVFNTIEQAKIMDDEQKLRKDLHDDTKGYISDSEGNLKSDEVWLSKRKLLNDSIKHRQRYFDPRINKKEAESAKVDSADAAKLLVNAVKFLSESKEKDVVSEQ